LQPESSVAHTTILPCRRNRNELWLDWQQPLHEAYSLAGHRKVEEKMGLLVNGKPANAASFGGLKASSASA
jgi:hypothetical protein